MKRLYSNGGQRDHVLDPYLKFCKASRTVSLAAPYFTSADLIAQVASPDRTIQLLVGLNPITKPAALEKVLALPNVTIRYNLDFHAKIFLFDSAAMIGSSNLTSGGLMTNREVMICLRGDDDAEALDEVRSLFADLWGRGRSFGKSQLDYYKGLYSQLVSKQATPADLMRKAIIEDLLPSAKSGSGRAFTEALNQEINDEYRPAFDEIGAILVNNSWRRREFDNEHIYQEINRFLNWIRGFHATGQSWDLKTSLTMTERRPRLIERLSEWSTTSDTGIPPHYFPWLASVRDSFASYDSIMGLPAEDLVSALLHLHAFHEQTRHYGGDAGMRAEFWERNDNALDRVRRNLADYLFGSGDFVVRLHDLLHDPKRKVALVGRYSALELMGSVRPEICPPMTSRMSKALRFLGFEVVV